MSTPDVTPSQLPPVPQYGEYAPGQQQVPQPPQYQPQQPSGPYQPQPASFPPQQQQQYGLQPYGAQYAQAPYGEQQYQGPYGPGLYGAKRPVRTADAIISILLLVFGLVGTLIAVGMATSLESFMQGGYDGAGVGATYEPTDAQATTAALIIASHLLLLAISTPITIVLIVKRKISFWLPLSAGVLAAIIFVGALVVLMYSDPIMSESLMNQSGY